MNWKTLEFCPSSLFQLLEAWWWEHCDLDDSGPGVLEGTIMKYEEKETTIRRNHQLDGWDLGQHDREYKSKLAVEWEKK